MKPRLTHQELLHLVARFVLEATESFQAGDLSQDDLPSAADVARALGLDTDVVKKKLKILKEDELVQAISVTPKRYRFNFYAFNALEEDSELYDLFLNSDSPYCLATV